MGPNHTRPYDQIFVADPHGIGDYNEHGLLEKLNLTKQK